MCVRFCRKQFVKLITHKNFLLSIAFCTYIVGVLWITVVSRIGSATATSILLPLWSYKEIAYGNVRVYKETILNIILFVPFGLLLTTKYPSKKLSILLFGFLFSLAIEAVQLLFRLGTFEVDDIINNALGSIVGVEIYVALKYREISKLSKAKAILVCTAFLLLCISVPISLKHNERAMQHFAHKNDKPNGVLNELIPNGEQGYIGKSGCFLRYHEDGYIEIAGCSEIDTHKAIGDIVLEAGDYVFLGDTDTNKVYFAIDRFDKAINAFIALVPRIHSNEEIRLQLLEKTKIRIYLGVSPDTEGKHRVCPVLYRED